MSFQRSPEIGQLAAAMAKAQGAMKAAVKNSKNPHFGNRYADLSACQDSYRGEFSKNGLAVFQPVMTDGQNVLVTTLVAHESGEWISATLTVPADKNTAQGIGSAITYGRRYGLALAGVVSDEDDDGNAASAKADAAKATPPPEGYQAFINALVTEAAKGTPALKAFWTKREHAAFREYLTATNPDSWSDIKTAASDADAVRAKAKAPKGSPANASA